MMYIEILGILSGIGDHVNTQEMVHFHLQLNLEYQHTPSQDPSSTI